MNQLTHVSNVIALVTTIDYNRYMTHKYSTIEGQIRQTMNIPIDRPEHTRWTRHEKVEFLEETTNFTRQDIFEELLRWMNEEEFSKFYDDYCSNWEIARDHDELVTND